MTQYITLPYRSKDITNQRFSRLVALGPIGKTSANKIIWLCQCDCGQTSEIIASHLLSENTKSCGCLHDETTKSNRRTHGKSGTPLYKTWKGIITRCTNPNSTGYVHWGGRGITIFNMWRHNFQAFHDYVTQLPDYGTKGLSLDRIDNNRNYEPGNLRWATATTQTRNVRSNRLITYNGKTQCITTWAKELKIPASTVFDRLNHGWSPEEALSGNL